MRGTAKSGDQGGIVERSPTPAQVRGNAAEALAAAFVAERGGRILARQFRCKAGEIDLIALCDQTLVFVEVRIRSHRGFGSAAESVTARKRQRIVRAAQWWLAGPGRHHAQRRCRFDVIAMDRLERDALQWLPGAFDAE